MQLRRRIQANEPLKKKQRATDVATPPPPPATHELQFMGSLPQDLFFATIGSPTCGLLAVQDLVALSLVSRSFYNAMDDAYWEKTLAHPTFSSICNGAAYTDLTPRERAVRLVAKRVCKHCRQFRQYEFWPLRPHGRKILVCEECKKLPEFTAIHFSRAVYKYRLKRCQLELLPSWKRSAYRGYTVMFNLKDVLDVVEQIKQYKSE
ncbi:hypothetical protein LEN26_009126 [Aphanomyces euteiches]|nr:hypothetical protein AeMF1_018355 [Aphanomyces euteiches]KAH9128266.1 hypothetical protein LEN26_009126 [Aphanomyces euteiches]KAH9187175.1 hypothetical protein AeNC1_010848 [Aphanomyces euteiches]